jgi:hypothetical protein
VETQPYSDDVARELAAKHTWLGAFGAQTHVSGHASAKGDQSGARFSASWGGDGNALMITITAKEAQFPDDASFQVNGEWEWFEFVEFVNRLDQRVRRTLRVATSG